MLFRSASPSSDIVQDIYPFLQAKIIASLAKLFSESVGSARLPPENITVAASTTATTESARVSDRVIRFFIFGYPFDLYIFINQI